MSDGGCATVVIEWLSHKLIELSGEKEALCRLLLLLFDVSNVKTIPHKNCR